MEKEMKGLHIEGVAIHGGPGGLVVSARALPKR